MALHLPTGTAAAHVDYAARRVTFAHGAFRFELERVGLMSVISIDRDAIVGYAVVGIDGRAACSNTAAEQVIHAWLEHCSSHQLDPWRRPRPVSELTP
ncbi:MAG: hypothetical protein HOV80_03385 [Polyangiaceae bacterium]|nr:hypothetical protein [Polyangiaceae bacterium]